jgi:hypothetical protein
LKKCQLNGHPFFPQLTASPVCWILGGAMDRYLLDPLLNNGKQMGAKSFASGAKWIFERKVARMRQASDA